MRKWTAMIAAVVMALLCAAAAAGGIETEEEARKLFESQWIGPNGSIRADCMYGYWEVKVISSDYGTEWDYVCQYDEARKVLVSKDGEKNTKTFIVRDEQGSEADRITGYTNGRAEFALTGEGTLVWTDMVEDAGAGFEYERFGWFANGFASDKYMLNIYWWDGDEEADNAGMIATVETFEEDAFWTYRQLRYNPENNTLEAALGMKEILEGEGGDAALVTVYEDGTALFSMDSEQNVTWRDDRENAGDGQTFELSNG